LWCVWAYEQHPDEAKARKVPQYTHGGRRYGKQGSPEDLAKLTTFALARDAAARRGLDGVGFALTADCGIIALDFDNCVTDGAVNPIVSDLVRGTYAEYSPSGKGVRAFFRGNLGNRKALDGVDGFGMETFSTSGFVTVTGRMLPFVDLLGHEDTIAKVTPEVEAYCLKRFGSSTPLQPDAVDFMAGYEPKLGLSVDESYNLLQQLDPDMGREDWIRVGMALHHEYSGEEEGFELWNEWSSYGSKYPDEEGMRVQWDSFTRRTGPGRKQITMATVKHLVKQHNAQATKNPANPTSNTISSAGGQTEITAAPYVARPSPTIPSRRWLLGYKLLRGTVATIIAPGGSGKTTWLATAALSVATGRQLIGEKVWGGPSAVWIWNLEDDLDELARLIEASCIHHDIQSSDFSGRLFVNSGMDGSPLCTTVTDSSGTRLHEPVYEAIKAQILHLGVGLLVIDPFVSSHSADENMNMEVDRVVKAWARVAKDADCCILLAHHTNKAGSVDVTTTSARGASALTNAGRTVLVVNRMSTDTAKSWSISDQDRRHYIVVRDDKHNRAPAEEGSWFKLQSVDLGNSNSIYPGDRVGVVELWTPPSTQRFDLTPQQIQQVQALAERHSYRENEQAGDWFGRPLAQMLGYDESDKTVLRNLIKHLVERRHLKIEQRPNQRKSLSPYIAVGPIRISDLEDVSEAATPRPSCE
jgi:RecA-family ATPase